MPKRRTDEQSAKSFTEKVTETIEQLTTLQNMQQALLRKLKSEAEREEKVTRKQ